ncbi:MAG: glutathione S-transferase N-terminal domain-containing protein [Gammaproteobacteria bacterium]|nr:glutathione S-transferase N-terminal domain-containing protein [Gammaproteobacteria bacterium]
MLLFIQDHCTLSDTVRIALRLKEIEHETLPLTQLTERLPKVLPEHELVVTQGITPILHDQNRTYIQSHAILEYLDESYPEVPLLMGMARDRIQTRSLMEIISSDIEPLINKRTMSHLNDVGLDTRVWQHYWLKMGFDLLETLLKENPARGRYCHGDTVTLADCYLVPQMWAAQDIGFDSTQYETLTSIHDHCMMLDEFSQIRNQ